MIRKLFFSLTLLLVVVSTACNAPPTTTSEVASDIVCQNLRLFITSVQQLQDTSKFADKTALATQFDIVRRNFNNLRSSVSSLNSAEKDDFETTVQNLMNQVDSLPENSSVSDTLTTLKDPIQQVVVAAQNLQTGLKCAP